MHSDGKNKTIASISKTYGSLGLGSYNVIITAGTGIAGAAVGYLSMQAQTRYTKLLQKILFYA